MAQLLEDERRIEQILNRSDTPEMYGSEIDDDYDRAPYVPQEEPTNTFVTLDSDDSISPDELEEPIPEEPKPPVMVVRSRRFQITSATKAKYRRDNEDIRKKWLNMMPL